MGAVCFQSVASAGAGFTIGVYNSGAGTITVDGNLAETVDDAASVTVDAGKLKVFWCNGSEWASVGGGISAPTLTTFTSTGTWTKKASSTIVISLLIGGGGGGGGGDATSLPGNVGQPGHAVVAVTLASGFGSSETVTIGTAGTGGTSGGNGGAGGQTSIGSVIKAKGGGGGSSPFGVGGAGGNASGTNGTAGTGNGAGGGGGGAPSGLGLGGSAGCILLTYTATA